MGGNTKGSKQALVRVVWSQLSRRLYSIEIKDQMCQEMWMVKWLLLTSSASEIPSACSLGECKFRGFEGSAEQRHHFFLHGTTQGLRRKRKIWRLLKNRCGIRDTSQVFATHVEEDLNEHGLKKDALLPCWYWKATLKTCSVHWRNGFILVISGVRANDLEQLMCETFRVRACERVDPGSLTTVEILQKSGMER